MPRIVLASSSPQRRDLLTRLGVRFAEISPPPDMTPPPGMCADLAAQLVARQKALAVAATQPADTFVIGADTVVLGPKGVWGKPGTPERAREMLTQLSGARHTVLTGICAIAAPGGPEELGFSRSQVLMRTIDPTELEEYIASGEPLDKAGAYAIQGGGSHFIEKVNGRVDTVVGLDVALALELLRKVGYPDALPAGSDTQLIQRPARRALAPLRGSRI